MRLPGRSGFRTSSAPPHWLRTFSIFFTLATSQGPSRPWQAYNWEIIPSCPRPFSEDTASADTTKGEPRPKRLTLHTGYGWVYVRDEEEGLLLYYYPLPLEHVPHSSSHADSDILAARSLIPCPRTAFCTATLHTSSSSYHIVLDMRVAGLQLEVANPQLSCVSKHPGRAFKTKLRAEMGVWLSGMCCVFRRVLVTTQT